jgi:predicted nucleic acid-binding protein
MSLEACATFGWPYTGIAQRLNRHPNEVQKLVRFRQAVETIVAVGVQLIAVLPQHVIAALAMSQRHGLLSNDALILALLQDQGLSQIASYDQDFDRVSNIQRFDSI